MKTSDFYYDLPKELIAQSPAECRSASRLLVYNRATKSIEDKVFSDIIDYLNPGDVLVRNTTRVIPARLYGTRPETGGKMEFLLLRRIDEKHWECLVKPGRRAKVGLTFKISDELSATVTEMREDGNRIIRLNYDGIFEEILDRAGEMPLPPYITERLNDKTRYQTVYAKENGSAAALKKGLILLMFFCMWDLAHFARFPSKTLRNIICTRNTTSAHRMRRTESIAHVQTAEG